MIVLCLEILKEWLCSNEDMRDCINQVSSRRESSVYIFGVVLLSTSCNHSSNSLFTS